jgi:ectoine hydroxylase-related dioxygenase (phytanoyl-CoA dioxygenase family)
MSVATESDVDQLIEEFKINGFIVIEDFIPIDLLDRITEAWLPIRDREIERQGDNPNRGANRYAIDIPLERPFVDPEIFDHPALVKLFKSFLGEEYIFQDYSSLTPFPGAVYQRWHRDVELLFPGLMTPPVMVAFRIPLCDATEENGSIEVLPGSHYIADKEVCYSMSNERRGKWFDHVLGDDSNRIGNYYPVRLNVKRGTIWLFDLRLFHRGTPNVSDHPRDDLIMHFSRPWFFSGKPHDRIEDTMPRELWDGLSAHARQVMRYKRIAG